MHITGSFAGIARAREENVAGYEDMGEGGERKGGTSTDVLICTGILAADSPHSTSCPIHVDSDAEDETCKHPWPHRRHMLLTDSCLSCTLLQVNDHYREKMWCQLISHLRMFGDPLRFRILSELINHGFPMPEDKLAQHIEDADPASTIAATANTPSPGPRVLCPRVRCPPVPAPPSGEDFLGLIHTHGEPDFMDFPVTESEKRAIAREEADKREAARRQHGDADAQEEMVNAHSEGDGESGMEGDGEGDGEGVGPEDGQEGRGEARMTNDTLGHDRADNGHGAGMTNGVEEETISEEDQHEVEGETLDEENQHDGGDDGGLEGEEDDAAAITLEETARCRHLLDLDQLDAQLTVTQLDALLDKCYSACNEFQRILIEVHTRLHGPARAQQCILCVSLCVCVSCGLPVLCLTAVW